MTRAPQAPVVSVIMPLHNSASFMAKSIRSVMAQTFGDWELLVVDDGSQDDSLALAKDLAAEDSRIRPLALDENRGAAAARNMGMKAAKGRYIAFLDSDDTWAPGKLTRQLDFMQDNDIAFSFTGYERKLPCGHMARVHVPPKLDYNGLLRHQAIGCLTAMYDTHKCGLQLMPAIRRRNDYALWLKLTRDGHVAHGLDENLATYMVRPSSLSANKVKAVCFVWRVYREYEGLGRWRSAVCFVQYAYHALLKRLLGRLPRRLVRSA